MRAKSQQQESSGRLAIITGVKTYLAFFVLIVLVVEALLGAVALRTQGQTQLVTIGGIVFVITVLIGVVTFCAYRKPEALLRSVAGPRTPQSGAREEFCRRISGHWWSRIISPQYVVNRRG